MGAEQSYGELAITPDSLWTMVQAEVAQGFNDRLMPLILARYLRGFGVDDRSKFSAGQEGRFNSSVQASQRKEESFFKAAVGVAMAALHGSPNAARYRILFDLDETLLTVNPTNLNEVVLRPSAVPLFRELPRIDEQGRLLPGLLTSRPLDYLSHALGDPQSLEPIAAYIDPAATLSSEKITRYSVGTYLETERDTPDEGTLQKITVINEKLQGDDGLCLALVDDQSGLNYVKQDERFRVLRLDSATNFRF